MSKLTKLAFGCFAVIVLLTLLIGLKYLASSEMTTYHKEVIGVGWHVLQPGVQKLLLILMKGTGDAVFVCGVSLLFLLLIPFRNGENWSRWAILTIGLSCLVPMLFGALYLAKTTGASSPWWLNAAMITLLLLGFFLSCDLRPRSEK